MKTIRSVMLIGLLLILALPVAAQRKVKFGIFDKATVFCCWCSVARLSGKNSA